MKKLLLVLVASLTFATGSFASHMMGGQITISHNSGMDYHLKYTAYRDMTGIPIGTVAMIYFVDSTSGANFTTTIPYDSLVTVLVPGVEEYVYETDVTFPNAGNWAIHYEECCRNAAIINMIQPSNESHYFYTNFLVDSLNSSPVFLNPPIVLGQDSVPFYYNPLPFDADGDSIAWSLDIPLSMNGAQVLGYSLPPSDSLFPFNMDPLTGEITFLPNTLGNFQVSLRVKEYRGGVQIGEITRDMQIIVVPSANRPANVSVNSNTFPYNSKNYTVAPGAPFNMTVSVVDVDGQNLRLSGAGEPLVLANNPAVFIPTNAVACAGGTLSWTPTAAQARTAPYVIGIRVSEDYNGQVFQSDLSITLRVGNSAGLNSINANSAFVLSPNPSKGAFNLQFTTSSSEYVRVSVMTVTGKVVSSFVNTQIVNGVNVIMVNDLGLSKGIYMVQLEQNKQKIGVQRLVVE
jgi:hypothetical protein